MNTVMPYWCPIGYVVERLEQSTGYWRRIDEVIPVKIQMQEVRTPVCFFLAHRQMMATNYHEAIQTARWSAVELASLAEQNHGTPVRICELQECRDPLASGTMKVVVWQDRKWLVTAEECE